MKFKGFEEKDFSLFEIMGFEERMEALKEQLRPKFYDLGDDLKDSLSAMVGEELFPHVAKHARRKTNPPNDSWVAWGMKRGYKMVPHFQVCVWSTHVLIQWGIIYEAKDKATFADNLLKHIEEVKREIPPHFQWYKDHTKPEGIPHSAMTKEDFETFANRLKNNKNGEVMVGHVILKEHALQMTPEQFIKEVLHTWEKLLFLHKLARKRYIL